MSEKEKNLFSLILLAIKNAFFPLKCLSCGVFLEKEPDTGQFRYHSDPPEKGYNLFLCDRCVLELKKPAAPLCLVCGKKLDSDTPDTGTRTMKCGICRAEPPVYKMSRSVFYYEGASRSLLHAFKYRMVTRLSDYLGLMLYRLIEKELGHASDSDFDSGSESGYVLLPVPLHKKKLRRRGFNQAELLVESIKKYDTGRMKLIVFREELLARTINTVPQSGLAKNERSDNVKNAFCVIMPERIKDRHVILVDDVYTTGSTVSACSSILLKAGAESVSVFTLARVRD